MLIKHLPMKQKNVLNKGSLIATLSFTGTKFLIPIFLNALKARTSLFQG